MKNAIVTVLMFVCMALLLSCKKKKKDTTIIAPTENILNSDANVIDSSFISEITPSSLTISKSALGSLKAGMILISAPTFSNPYGILRKVLSVEEINGILKCQTEQSNLNEAFKQLYIDTTILVNHDDSTALKGTSTGTSLTIRFNNNNTIVPGIKFEGKIKINIASVNIEYKKSATSIKPDKIVVKANINTAGSVMEITNTSNSSVTAAESLILHRFDKLPPLTVIIPVTTPVGIFPIPMRFSQKIIFKTLPITISGKAKWTILPEISATLGAKFENGIWTNLNTLGIDASSMPLSKGDFTPTLELIANCTIFNPRYEIAPFALENLKTFFEVPSSIQLRLQTTSPNYILNYKLDATGGIQTKFWNGEENEYSITGSIIDKVLLQGEWDFLPAVVTKPVGILTLSSIRSGGIILSDGGRPITSKGICWSLAPNPTILDDHTSNGPDTTNFNCDLNFNSETTWHLRAYATNDKGTAYGNDISFNIDDTLKQMLTNGNSKSWHVASYYHINAIPDTMASCVLDDVWTFNSDGTFLLNKNGTDLSTVVPIGSWLTKRSCGTGTNIIGTWVIRHTFGGCEYNVDVLVPGFTYSFFIKKISNSSMQVYNCFAHDNLTNPGTFPYGNYLFTYP